MARKSRPISIDELSKLYRYYEDYGMTVRQLSDYAGIPYRRLLDLFKQQGFRIQRGRRSWRV